MGQAGHTTVVLMQQTNNYYMQSEAGRPPASKQNLGQQVSSYTETGAQAVRNTNQNYNWPHWEDYNWQPIRGR